MEETLESRLQTVADWLQQEFSGIRTGQAAPGFLDGVKVEQYGSMLPINQVGSVGIEDARTLRISPWDVGNLAAIERAIREADLGVSVATDSAGLRVIFPELTSERRVQLIKLAKQKFEEARVSVRSIRDDVIRDIEKQFKAGELSEDDKFAEKERVQSKVDEINKKLEALYQKKEQEIGK